jgi:hypothetical protein
MQRTSVYRWKALATSIEYIPNPQKHKEGIAMTFLPHPLRTPGLFVSLL